VTEIWNYFNIHHSSKFTFHVALTLMLLASSFQDTVFDPVALGCGHVFCNSCVCAAASVPAYEGPRAADSSAKCPLCRKVRRTWIWELATRHLCYFIIRIINYPFAVVLWSQTTCPILAISWLLTEISLYDRTWEHVSCPFHLLIFKGVLIACVQVGVYLNAVRLKELATLVHNR